MTFVLRCPACAGPLPVPSTPSADGEALVCSACGYRAAWRDGVLHLDDEPGEGCYPAELSALDARIEADHWWSCSRNAVITRALRAQIARRKLRSLVEVGCGTGFVLSCLRTQGLDVLGLDMQAAGLAIARTRTDAPLVRSGAPLPLAESVDSVALCDVLEHADEGPLLAACRDGLRPGGLLLVTTPAQPWLWSTEDAVVGHRRRYTRASLRAALEAAGLCVVRLRPFHAFVTPLALLSRWRSGPPQVEPPDDPVAWLAAHRHAPSAPAKRLFGALAAIENRLGARVPLPFASHLLALAERPAD